VNTVRLVGSGRAGGSLVGALTSVDVRVRDVLGRGDDLSAAAADVDALVIATPDDSVGEVAAAVRPVPSTVVMHLSGSLGLDVLSPHARRASMHPLAALPDAEVGRLRLRSGISFAVAGDPSAAELVRRLGGQPVAVAEADRATYHAAACIASNHVVALLGQVERLAQEIGLDLDVFLGLTWAALADVAARGPAAALTGPAARGDLATLQRHRDAIAPDELEAYDAGVALARRLVSEVVPC
jgi:predicted short-subunit dehydrogenase-like oxidoreductase (DUF2520 family)